MRAAARNISRLLTLLLALSPPLSANAYDFGAFGPEGPRMREQLWLLPSGDKARTLRATVFRPEAHSNDTEGQRLPLVIINHGTDEATRLSLSLPVYYWLSRWFVERGYAVVLPQRRGHGATGGELSEALDTCAATRHADAGNTAADDIAAVTAYMEQQSFVDPDRIVVAGISTGGWASLALAARNPPGVKAIVNFSGGRGGHAYGQRNEICGEDDLIAAAAQFATSARVPSLWLYARNDSYFGPRLIGRLAGAWTDAGASAQVHIFRAYGSEGHTLADDRAGWDLWGGELEDFLTRALPSRDEPALASTSAGQPETMPAANGP